MDYLRWILLGVGAVIVLGVYLWGRRERAHERSHEEEAEARWNEAPDPLMDPPEQIDAFPDDIPAKDVDEDFSADDVVPVVERVVDGTRDEALNGDALDEELEGLDRILEEEAGLEAGAPAPSKAAPADEAIEERVVVIYLVAPRDEPFRGTDLARAFTGEKLRYGDMQIYHRLGHDGRSSLFSIANLVEPGNFDPKLLKEMRTPGLAFFLRLPCDGDALVVFDDMIKTAQKLAHELHGELRDASRSLLSKQAIEHERDGVREFARRMRLVSR